MQAWHEVALRMYFMGYKQKHIVRAVEKHKNTIDQLVHSPLGRAFLDAEREKTLALFEQTHTELRLLLPRAVQECRDALDSKDAGRRDKAWKFILESQGFTPVRRVEVRRIKAGEEGDWVGKSAEEMREMALAALTVETIATRVDDEQRESEPESGGAENSAGHSAAAGASAALPVLHSSSEPGDEMP